MEFAKGIIIPVLSDYVLSPEVYYGDKLTGIYFPTEDEKFGRITFQNLDAIKVCRGENLPYKDDWEQGKEVAWVFKIENSKWLRERFNYENENYGSSYEFGGDVNEMLTDFNHYLFSFHDQFVEVIAKGFWFEKDDNDLFKKDLKEGHPFLSLSETEIMNLETSGIKYRAIFNTTPTETLIHNIEFCEQKLIEIAIEYEGNYSVSHTLTIMKRQGKMVSSLRSFFGKPIFEKEGLMTFDEIKPMIEKEIYEISERRKRMKK